jgi:ATP-dependent Clp protease ATP-binding subunit ClpA
MFERFTERARQVVVFAQEEARTTEISFISTEHILVGLIREEEGLSARVLASLDVTLERVREMIAEEYESKGVEKEPTEEQIPFTPRAKQVLELGLREALSLGHNYIGTEHLLLGLIRSPEGLAARILTDLVGGEDATFDQVIRNEVIRMLTGPGGRRQEKPATAADTEARKQIDGALVDGLREAGHAFVTNVDALYEEQVKINLSVAAGETSALDVLYLTYGGNKRFAFNADDFADLLVQLRENARAAKELGK